MPLQSLMGSRRQAALMGASLVAAAAGFLLVAARLLLPRLAARGADAAAPGTVRKSKQEKRAERYERARTSRKTRQKEQAKRSKAKKTEGVTTAEDWAALKQSNIDAKRAREERFELLQARAAGDREAPFTLAIDLSLDSEHTERERRSLAKQLSDSYAVVKNAPDDAAPSFHLCSYLRSVGEAEANAGGADALEEADACASAAGTTADALRATAAQLVKGGAEHWACGRHQQPAWAAFPGRRVVYLSPDAEDCLPLDGSALDPEAVYVIGGVVDRSIAKNRTRDHASQRQVRCARLPFREVCADAVSNYAAVLNIDAVVRALVHYQSGRDWRAALLSVVPARKLKQPPAKAAGSPGDGRRDEAGDVRSESQDVHA